MENDDLPLPIRLMNFVSEDQLVEARRTRGLRVEDCTAQRDRPLFEENKDKKDAEFNERFKHRPPKALDEDETEFLDKLEMSRRELERQLADEEERELQLLKAQSAIVHEKKEEPSIPKIQDKKSALGKKNPPPRPTGVMIKVKPQTKRAKVNPADAVETTSLSKTGTDNTKELLESVHSVHTKQSEASNDNISSAATSGLVSYSDESDDD